VSEIYDLSDRYVERYAALDPVAATLEGLTGHDDEMTDFSPDGYEERNEHDVATLKALERAAVENDRDRIAGNVLLAFSAPLLWISTRGLQAEPPSAIPSAVGMTDWRLLRRSRALALILLVTVICNLCYFAFLPLVPVIAKHLNAGAVMAGVIGATAGIVQLVITAVLVVRPVRRPLNAYTFGVALCLCCLAILAYTPVLTVALLTLGVAGIGQALFGSTQATLPVAAVAPHERAAALGLLSTTIGVALPTGMVVLGVTSSLLGAQPAMLMSALFGLAALAATVLGNSGRAIGVGGEGDSIAAQPELG